MAKQYLLASVAGLKQLLGRLAANWRLSDDRDCSSNIFYFGHRHGHRLDAARDSAEPPQGIVRQGAIVLNLNERSPYRSNRLTTSAERTS